MPQPVYFHVAPPGSREPISDEHLLWAGQSEDVLDLREQGVYLFDNLGDAHRFGRAAGPAVDATGKELGEQPWFSDGYDIWRVVLDPYDQGSIVPDPLETGGWMVPTEHAIEPVELQLHESVRP